MDLYMKPLDFSDNHFKNFIEVVPPAGPDGGPLMHLLKSISGLQTGVVIDPHPEANGFETAIRRLAQKIDAGAQFAVTQPIYDAETVDIMAQATQSMGIPVIMGILPLRTARHADFLHQKVAGIAMPKRLREQMHQADDTIKTGNQNAREMLAAARERFAGACIMPPFDHYEVLEDILNLNSPPPAARDEFKL